jgi:5,6-dimethylbenzimidazole synthase
MRSVRTLRTSNARELAGRGGDDAQHYASLKLAGLDDAPHHIAVFCETNPAQGRGLGRGTMPQTTTWSAVMAIHTFLACSNRTGHWCWLGFHSGPKRGQQGAGH